MKKRINLLLSKKKQKSPALDLLRKIGTGIIIVLFITFLASSFFHYQQRTKYDGLLANKRDLLQYFQDNVEIEAKINVFLGKKAQLDTYLEDDARFLPYYSLLNDLISISEDSPIIENMTIDNTKSTEFTIRFSSYRSAYEFIKYVESPKFLDKFIDLSLRNFSLISQVDETKDGYEFDFVGKFKQIDENSG